MLRVALTAGVLLLAVGVSFAAPMPKGIKAKPWVRKKIEPRWGEKVYSVEWNNVPFRKVAEELEQLTGLLYLSKDVPDVKITLKAEKVCVAELCEQINDELEPHNFVVLKKTQSFATVPADVKPDFRHAPRVTLDDMPNMKPREAVVLFLPVGEKGYEAGKEVLRSMERNFMQVSEFGPDKLLIRGLGKDVQKFVDEMGDHLKR